MFVLNEQSENNLTRHTHTHSTHEFTRQKSTHFIHNLIGLIAIKKRNKKNEKERTRECLTMFQLSTEFSSTQAKWEHVRNIITNKGIEKSLLKHRRRKKSTGNFA